MAKAAIFKHLHTCLAERSCSNGLQEQRAPAKNLQEGKYSLNS